MIEVPTLHSADLARELEKYLGAKRNNYLFAFFGTGQEEALRVAGTEVLVRPVRSELELRAQLHDLPDEARVAFLVPFTDDIPIDIRSPFAKSGRVFRIGDEMRLRRIFGVNEVWAEARSSSLAKYLVKHAGDVKINTTSGVLTPDVMWLSWLRHELGMEAAGGLALDVLLAFAARDARGPTLVRTLEERGASDVRAELVRWVKGKLGVTGELVLAAWMGGKGAQIMELALLAECVSASKQDAVGLWLRGRMKAELDTPSVETLVDASSRLGAAVSSTLFLLQRAGLSSLERSKLYEAAEARIDEALVRVAVGTSSRLPLAFRAQLAAFGEALFEASAQPTLARFEQAKRAYEVLVSHELATSEGDDPRVGRAEQALRLLAFLVAPTHAVESSFTAYGDAETLGAWYVAEGGYLDWARYQARTSGDDAFARGVNAVVAAVDRIRAELDARFAKALQKWVEARRPDHTIIPIDRALDRVAVSYLAEYPTTTRLLVLLIDGMAWAQAVELLGSLSSERASVPWATLAHRGWAKGTAGQHPVVFAALPTITEVSRAAFFAGAVPASGTKEPTSKDPERFAKHKGLLKVSAANAVPRLLLQSSAFGTDGHLNTPAVTLISDKDVRCVGLVINAIDDALKANATQEKRWTLADIRGLTEILEVARASGRAVLLASDHGHVPGDRLSTTSAKTDGGARYRSAPEPNVALLDNELVFSGDGVRAERGHHGVVLPVDDTIRYSPARHAGEHGGATLAEVVTPCILLGSALDDIGEEKSAKVVPVEPPRWWRLDITRPAEGVSDLRVTTTPKTPKVKISANQLSLLEPAAPSEPAVVVPVATKAVTKPRERHTTVAALASSALFVARAPKLETARAAVLDAVEHLVVRNGASSAEAFTSDLAVLSYRIGGIISNLQTVLNVDGYQIIWHEIASRQVRLDVPKLVAQFGLEKGAK